MIVKAAVLGEKGIEVRDLPKPEPKPNEVLIRVRASSLNRADLLVAAGISTARSAASARGSGSNAPARSRPSAARCKDFKPGDRVMGSAPGGFAEYAVTDAGRVHRIPANNMTYEQAACFPVALQTMHNAVVTAGRLKRGETLLIQGASSGVGLMGMQIGKLMGASLVIGTSTNAKRRARLEGIRLRSSRIDSSKPNWPEEVKKATGGKGVNLIVDMVSAPRRQSEPRSGGAARPHRQCRPARRHEGRIQLRPACAQAHRLYRRHLPHPHARGNARDRQGRCAPTCGRRSRPAS